MKRYTTGEIYWARQHGEDPDTEYYSRADLIAAGVLVPVADREACRICDAGHTYIMVNGKVYFPEEYGDWCGIAESTRYLHQEIGGYDEDLIVQPVRLVPIAEAVG